MKKTILLTALMTGLMGSAHAAKSDESSITLYGVVDVGYQYGKAGTQQRSSTTQQMSGHETGSHFGLMGSEPLGNGLHAKFALEAGFETDTGKSENALFDRQAWVGLGGNFGEIRLGRQEHVTSLLTSAVDPFNNSFGDAATGADYNGHILFMPHYQDRANNAVAYVGKFANDSFQIGANYSTEAFKQEVQGTGNNNRWAGIALNYTWKDLMVAASYDRWFRPNGEFDAQGNHVSLGKQTNLNYWSAGATYDLHFAKLHAGYYRSDYAVQDGLDSEHGNAWLVGLSAPIGSNQQLMASYKHGKDISAKDHDVDSYAVGYTYGFSKRTNLYASYAYTKIEEANMVDDWKRDELTLGVQHRF